MSDQWSYCPHCGVKLIAAAKFCHACGTAVNHEEQTLSPSESAAVSAAWSVVCEWAAGQGIDPPMEHARRLS
jgi:hypothetical protein